MTAASIAVSDAPAQGSARRLAILLMGGALLSKVLGLVREVMIAHAIGASMIADSFRGALTAVLLPLAFIQTESVPAVLIPAYREWVAEGNAPRRFGELTIALTALATAIFLLVETSAHIWIDALLGGFDAEGRALTLTFTRVMALSMPASVLLCCLSATEIARGQSSITSIRATLVNVAVIIGVGVLLVTGRPVALAWSFSIAFNLVAVVTLAAVWRSGAIAFDTVTPTSAWAALRQYFRRFRPLVLQPVAEYAEIWIERLLASRLFVGTLASLDYARTLSDCATLLVSQPLGLAVLSAGPAKDPRVQMDQLARPVLALAVPGSVFLMCFAPELVTLVFHRGAFDERAIAMTSGALAGIAAGLWATTLGWVLVRMLNSVGRNRRATAIVSCAYIANALVAALLIQPLGIFALGFGEAMRGVVLLVGVSLALGCGRHLLRLLFAAAPIAAVLLAADVAVRDLVSGVIPRLLLGTGTTAVGAAVAVLLLVPAVRSTVAATLRKRMKAA